MSLIDRHSSADPSTPGHGRPGSRYPVPIAGVVGLALLLGVGAGALLLTHTRTSAGVKPSPVQAVKQGAVVPAGAPECGLPTVSVVVPGAALAAGVKAGISGTATIDPSSSKLLSLQIVALPPGTRPDLAALQVGQGSVATTSVASQSLTSLAAGGTFTAPFTLSFPASPAGSYSLVALVTSVPGCRGEESGTSWSTQPLQTDVMLK